MNNFTTTIELLEQIIRSYDSHNLKSLSNKINSMLFNDPELHCITVMIKKNKFQSQIDSSKTALIIHLI